MFGLLRVKSVVMVLAAAAVGLSLAASEASARVKVGVLQCKIGPGIGLIVVSKKRLDCTFSPTGYKTERYTGSISKLGVDLGFSRGGVLVWAVFAPTAGYSRHALAGHYGGAQASASLIAGLGANALVGGSNRSFALQPFSIQGQTGVNLAVGVAAMDLHAR